MLVNLSNWVVDYLVEQYVRACVCGRMSVRIHMYVWCVRAYTCTYAYVVVKLLCVSVRAFVRACERACGRVCVHVCLVSERL